MEEPEKVMSYLEFARTLSIEAISDAMFLSETEYLTDQEFLIEAHRYTTSIIPKIKSWSTILKN